MRLTRLAIATAPALFVLLWSTGFIGARYGLPYIEPLTFLAVRMVFAVVIMGIHGMTDCFEEAAAAVRGGGAPFKFAVPGANPVIVVDFGVMQFPEEPAIQQ